MEKLDISILFVEDEGLLRAIYERILVNLVETLYVAENGKEGLEIYKKYHPDLIISDTTMPVMDGLEMIDNIKKIDNHVRLVILSTYGEAEYFMDAIKIGVNSFLLKPVETKKLISLVEELAKGILLERQVKAIEEQKKIAEENLRKLNQELEKRVEERTKDLQKEIKERIQAEDELNELKKREKQQTVYKTKITNIPYSLLTSIQQYLLFFREYVNTCKQIEINFNVLVKSKAIELIFEVENINELEQIKIYLEEYIELSKSEFIAPINVENNCSKNEIDILKLRLEQQISNFKMELKFCNFKSNFFENNLNELKKQNSEMIGEILKLNSSEKAIPQLLQVNFEKKNIDNKMIFDGNGQNTIISNSPGSIINYELSLLEEFIERLEKSEEFNMNENKADKRAIKQNFAKYISEIRKGGLSEAGKTIMEGLIKKGIEIAPSLTPLAFEIFKKIF